MRTTTLVFVCALILGLAPQIPVSAQPGDAVTGSNAVEIPQGVYTSGYPTSTDNSGRPGARGLPRPEADSWDDVPEGIGSVDDYDRDDGDSDLPAQFSSLGIMVCEGVARLENGQPVRGLGIVEVARGGPGQSAGLLGERSALHSALVGTLVLGTMVFPPAMLGLAAVEATGLGQPRDVIIAVDSNRTRQLVEFEDAIEKASTGKIVYLTIVRAGQRKQITVEIEAKDHQGDSPLSGGE